MNTPKATTHTTSSETQWLYVRPATENVLPLNHPLTNQQACPVRYFPSLIMYLEMKLSELQVWISWEVQSDVSAAAVHPPWGA